MTQCMVRPCVARGFVELAVSGLASMYPAFDWSVMLRATMDISARAISLADRPQRAIWVTSVRMRRDDRSSISSHPLADLGRYGCWATSSGSPHLRLDDQAAATSAIVLASTARPRARTLPAMRASLLASAIARTL